MDTMLISEVGRALWGPAWKGPMAEAVRHQKSAVADWASGRLPVPAGVWNGTASERELDRYARQRRLVTLEYIEKQSIENKRNLECANPEFAAELRRTAADPRADHTHLVFELDNDHHLRFRDIRLGLCVGRVAPQKAGGNRTTGQYVTRPDQPESFKFQFLADRAEQAVIAQRPRTDLCKKLYAAPIQTKLRKAGTPHATGHHQIDHASRLQRFDDLPCLGDWQDDMGEAGNRFGGMLAFEGDQEDGTSLFRRRLRHLAWKRAAASKDT